MTETSASAPGTNAGDELCVARVPVFQGLTHEQQLDVAQIATSERFAIGEQVYAAGADMSQLMVVHTGRIMITRTTVAGTEQLLRVLGPGNFIGESAFLTGARPDHAATALESAQLCVFRHADLGRLVSRHVSIGLRMLETMSRRLDDTEARLASIVSGNVTTRLADYLLSLPVTRGEDGDLEVTLPMAKKHIASLLDTTPESLSRQLRRFTDDGLITQRGRATIVLRDVAALTSHTSLSGHTAREPGA